MKILVLIARILMGLVFLVFGFNHIVPFIPMKQMPTGDEGLLLTVMLAHGWFKFYGLVEVVGGLMLLVGWFVPLGLTLLAGVGVNILLFNITLSPSALPIPLVLALLEIFLVYAYRDSFAGIFAAKPNPLV